MSYYDLTSIEAEYDLVIIGGGPAGCTAAIYGKRDDLSVLILEKQFMGGALITTYEVENYPGIPETISGVDLAKRFYQHAENLGAHIRNGTCTRIEKEGKIKLIHVDGMDKPIRAKTVILCTGASPRLPGATNEDKFFGKGLSVCATCDGVFYKGKTVAVIGGGDAAVEEGEYLTRHVDKIFLIHRRVGFRAAKVALDRFLGSPKVETILDTVVKSMEGDPFLETLILENTKTGETTELKVDGLFVFVGSTANSEGFENMATEIDSNGYFITDNLMNTGVEGVFAAGDCRKKEVYQITTATNDGTLAAKGATKFIIENF